MRTVNPDLNLVRTLVAVADARSASGAADRLGMSQPGISNALRRLRAAYGDPLFVRSGRGLDATPRAEELVAAGRRMLEVFEREMLGRAQFNPGETTREFRFVMSDIGEMVFLPRLLEHLRRLAPNAPVRAVSVPHAQLMTAMQTGEVDLAVGYFPDLRGGQSFQQKLFGHGFTCLVRKGHPCAGEPLTKRKFCGLSHAVVQAQGRSQEVFEAYLSRLGLRRRIALHVPHFMSIPYVIAKSDLLVTVPVAVGTAFSERGDVQLLKPTFTLPRFDLKQHWHRRFHKDARNRWLRTQVASLFNPGTDGWRGL
jgi:DNA-binding transcriptional LysR family regulator